MSLRLCIMTTLGSIAAMYIAWFTVVNSRQPIERHNTQGAPDQKRAERKASPPPQPIVIAVAPKNQAPAPPAPKAPPQTAAASKPVAELPAQAGALGASTTRFDLLVESALPDVQLLHRLRQEQCQVVAFKVKDGQAILDSFLADETGQLKRVTAGPDGDATTNRFLADHPSDRCRWIRWHDSEHAIGREVNRALRTAGVAPEEFIAYVVLNNHLARDLDRRAAEKARAELRPLERIGYVQVALLVEGRRFESFVLRIAAAESPTSPSPSGPPPGKAKSAPASAARPSASASPAP